MIFPLEMTFVAEKGQSESDKHPLLIYRSTANPYRCFKFCFKRPNKGSNAYICLGCQQAKDKGHEIEINSIRVNLECTHFLSNPEQIAHPCLKIGYVFDYMTADIQQMTR